MLNLPFLLLFTIILEGRGLYTFKHNVYFVSPIGTNSATGTIDNPFKTIQKAVTFASAFDTIYIRKGIYREYVNIAGPNKKGLCLLAYNNERALLKGSDAISDWQYCNGYWKKHMQLQPQQVMVNGDHPLQQIGYPNNNFKFNTNNRRYIFPVGYDLSDMKPGRYYWQNDTLYIWPLNSSNPNKLLVEVSQRSKILNIQAENVYVKGLLFRHSNCNTNSEQGVAVQLGINSTITDCDIQWCDFGGIGMATNSKAYNCNVSNNGDSGFNAYKSFNFLISRCKANKNNYRNFYAQWHAGGLKATTSSWGTIERSEFSYNTGAGIWFDYCFEQDKNRNNGHQLIVIRDNYVHHNSNKTDSKNSAIIIEMSENAYIQNNIIINNNDRAIYISGSWNCNILNNVIAFNYGYYTIDLAGVPRAGESRAKLVNNRIEGNILANNKTTSELQVPLDNGNDIHQNHVDKNSIYRDNGRLSFKSDKTYYSLSEWQKATNFNLHPLTRKLTSTDTVYNQIRKLPPSKHL